MFILAVIENTLFMENAKLFNVIQVMHIVNIVFWRVKGLSMEGVYASFMFCVPGNLWPFWPSLLHKEENCISLCGFKKLLHVCYSFPAIEFSSKDVQQRAAYAVCIITSAFAYIKWWWREPSSTAWCRTFLKFVIYYHTHTHTSFCNIFTEIYLLQEQGQENVSIQTLLTMRNEESEVSSVCRY